MLNDLPSEKLNIAICDDNCMVLDKLLLLAKRTLSPQWDADFFCTTSPAALADCASPIHIAVLDIALEGENGISLARRLLQHNPDCRIVFVSGYLQFVSDVYDVPHLGMVLKDQLEVHLPKFLLQAAESIRTSQEQTLSIPLNRTTVRLQLSSILYLERTEHITWVFLTSGQKIKTRVKLGELLSQRCCETLCRCHVSYAVNLSQVISLQGREFALTSGERIPISRVYLQNARTAYFAFLQTLI